MSLASKLNYLKQTKEAIKNALIGKGAIVATTDTFRSYAQKIEELESGTDLETIEIPIFKLKGDNPQTITKDSQYQEQGVELLNHADTTELNVDTSALNTSVAGTYSIIYTVTNTQSNASSILRRTVEVIGQAPVIKYQGETTNPIVLEEGKVLQSTQIYVEDATSIVLTRDGATVAFTSGDNLSIEGNYTITATNENGTTTINFRIDNTDPIIEGLEGTMIKKDITITFKDIEDLASVTLVTPNDGTIDILALYKAGQLQTDANGNYIYVIKFKEEEADQSYYFKALDRAGNLFHKTLTVIV